MPFTNIELNNMVNHIISQFPKNNPYLIFEEFKYNNKIFYKNNMGYIINHDGQLVGFCDSIHDDFDYKLNDSKYIFFFKKYR